MRSIDADALKDDINVYFADSYHLIDSIAERIDAAPTIESGIILCKDCKHKPYTSDKYDYDNGDCGFEIIFPDYRCPCRCEDEYYNRIPDDDWYCGNAERRTDEGESLLTTYCPRCGARLVQEGEHNGQNDK